MAKYTGQLSEFLSKEKVRLQNSLKEDENNGVLTPEAKSDRTAKISSLTSQYGRKGTKSTTI